MDRDWFFSLKDSKKRSLLKNLYKNIEIKNYILFDCYHGRDFDCNPKAILDFIIKNELFSDFEIIITYNKNNHENFLYKLNTQKRNYTFIEFLSDKYIDLILKSKIVIMNSILPQWIPTNPEKQIIINTWHGGGNYKTYGMCNPQEKSPLFNYCKTQYTKILIDNQSAIKSTRKALLLKNDQMLNIGYPRIDRIIKESENKPSDKKLLIVLYAPTYRSPEKSEIVDLNSENYKPDFNRLTKNLMNKFEVNFVNYIYHGHRYDKSNFEGESENYTILDSKNLRYDLNDLILLSDILITDYSSILWDYSFKKDAIIFRFCKDFDFYKKYRGFFNELPLKACKNDDELESEILNYNKESQIRVFENEHKKLGSFEDGHACERLIKYIEEKINE